LAELKGRRVYGLGLTLLRVSEETYFSELFGKLVKQMLFALLVIAHNASTRITKNSKTSIWEASSMTRDFTGRMSKRPHSRSFGFESMLRVHSTTVAPPNVFKTAPLESGRSSERITLS
jgi:hypothetical protein